MVAKKCICKAIFVVSNSKVCSKLLRGIERYREISPVWKDLTFLDITFHLILHDEHVPHAHCFIAQFVCRMQSHT